MVWDHVASTVFDVCDCDILPQSHATYQLENASDSPQCSTNGRMGVILTALWCLSADSKAVTDGIDSNLEQTRTIVASLQTAVDFVKVLSESLAVLTQLLASSTMTDVQESITLVIYCHKFQVLLSLS